MTAQSISTSTNALATAYSSGQLVAYSASGDALVVWYDGSNVKWSYASSPYTSWTTASLITSISGRWEASLYKLSNDNALLVCSNGSGNMVSYLFTYSSGSHNWSAGSAVTVLSSGGAFNGGAVAMDADAQGRIWAAWSNNSHVVQIKYTTDNGSTWTASTTFSQVSGGDDTCVNLAYIGNYIVVAFCGASAVWKYARIDAHSASLGSWSSATTISNCTMDNTVLDTCLRGAPGSNYGILAGDFGSIPTQNYNSNTDTWSSVTSIGSSSDKQPTLITDGTDLYCVWSKFSASNNFSLVFKKWVASTQTWDSASTQLEANGSNIARASGGFGNSKLAFVYTVGTANPWTVYFDTYSTSSVTTNSRTITPVTVALLATSARTIPATVALKATKSRTIPATVALKQTGITRTIPATSALKQTSSRTIPATSALKATLVRTVSATVALKATGNTRTIPTTAALGLTSARTVPATSALKASQSRTVPATSALIATRARTIPATSALFTTGVRTISTSAALLSTKTRSISATSALKATLARTVSTTTPLLLTASRTIPASAALDIPGTHTRTILITAALKAIGLQRTLPASGALLLRGSRTIPETAALKSVNSKTLAAQAALLARQSRTVPTSADLFLRSTRTVSAQTALMQTSSRVILVRAALMLARVIPTSAALSLTGSRVIVSSACLIAGITKPNATVLLRSGQASMVVPSGEATVLVSSGQATVPLPSGEATAIIRSGEATLIKRS